MMELAEVAGDSAVEDLAAGKEEEMEDSAVEVNCFTLVAVAVVFRKPVNDEIFPINIYYKRTPTGYLLGDFGVTVMTTTSML